MMVVILWMLIMMTMVMPMMTLTLNLFIATLVDWFIVPELVESTPSTARELELFVNFYIVIVTFDHICRNHNPQHKSWCWSIVIVKTTVDHIFKLIPKSSLIIIIYLWYFWLFPSIKERPAWDRQKLVSHVKSHRETIFQKIAEKMAEEGKLYQVLGGTKAKRLHNLSCKERTEVSKIEFEKLLWQKFSFVSIFP